MASKHKPRFPWDEAARILGGHDALEDALDMAVQKGITSRGAISLWRPVQKIPAGTFAYILVALWGAGLVSTPGDPETEAAVWQVRRVARHHGKDSPE